MIKGYWALWVHACKFLSNDAPTATVQPHFKAPFGLPELRKKACDEELRDETTCSRKMFGRSNDVGALPIRIGFQGPLYYDHNKPKHSFGNYLGILSIKSAYLSLDPKPYTLDPE